MIDFHSGTIGRATKDVSAVGEQMCIEGGGHQRWRSCINKSRYTYNPGWKLSARLYNGERWIGMFFNSFSLKTNCNILRKTPKFTDSWWEIIGWRSCGHGGCKWCRAQQNCFGQRSGWRLLIRFGSRSVSATCEIAVFICYLIFYFIFLNILLN